MPPSPDPRALGALTEALAAGRDYLWALRQAHEGGRDALRETGIDDHVLGLLRTLETALVRPPQPACKLADHRYLNLQLPGGVDLFFAPLICERGVESGTELFPHHTTWTFAHHEMQYCTGGQTPMRAVLPHGGEQHKLLSAGDVMAIPEGTELTYRSSEVNGFGHSHIFAMNLSGRPTTFYDAVPRLLLRARRMVDGSQGEPPQLHDVRERIQLLDWGQLIRPRPDGAHELPTWLRNGWSAREQTRALDYHEGTRSLVITSPDRDPDAFLPWGTGRGRCRVNPLIAEAVGAITDCVLPAGWFGSPARTELWTVLRGQAEVRQTQAPLHDQSSHAQITSGATLVVPAGARVEITDASEDLVLRRLAESCAHNGHWAMMEAKLIEDGHGSANRRERAALREVV